MPSQSIDNDDDQRETKPSAATLEQIDAAITAAQQTAQEAENKLQELEKTA